MEIVYKLKVHDGKITGTQTLPFGESPIVDGEIIGDAFHFTVELESFYDIQKREVAGDTLVLTPAMPRPPVGIGPPGDQMHGRLGEHLAVRRLELVHPPAFQVVTVTARRGTPTPSYRAPQLIMRNCHAQYFLHYV